MPDTVWVTRPLPGAMRTATAIEEAGFTVISAPVLEIAMVGTDVPKEDPDWILFASQNAVTGLVQSLGERRPSCRVAAVGERTRDYAERYGFSVELVPEEQHASGLLEAMREIPVSGTRLWIPTGDRGRKELQDGLAARGAKITSLNVYQTRERQLTDDEIDTLATTSPGAILFYSPSAAEAVFAHSHRSIRNWCGRALAVAIGPTTRVRLENLGASQIVEAAEPSEKAVLDLLVQHLGENR